MCKTPPTVRIVTATADDIPLILSFIGKLAEYERLTDEVEVEAEALRKHLFGERRAAEVILAYLGEDAVGFAIFFMTFSSFAGRPGIYLEDLFVDEEERGKGVGKALLKHLAKLAVERGYARFEWAVLDWNEPSINFYRKLGAEPLDAWTTYRLTGEPLRLLAGK